MGTLKTSLLANLTLILAAVVGQAAAQQPMRSLPAYSNGPYLQEHAPAPDPVTGYSGAIPQWDQERYFSSPPSADAIGPCCDLCGGGGGCPPLWALREEVRILTRTRARELPVSVNIGSGADISIATTTKDLAFDIAPGYSTTMERFLGRDAQNRDWFLEAGFWGLNHWVSSANASASQRVVDDTAVGLVTHGSLSSPFGATFPGLDWADFQEARYNSEFNTAEISLVVRPRSRPDRLVLHPNGKWRRECQPGLFWSFLFGFKYFNVNEQFHLSGSGTANVDVDRDGNDELVGIPTSGDMFVNTRNNMYGLQFGAELMKRDCVWEYGMRFHVAPMINVATAVSQIETVNLIVGSPGLGPIEDDETRTAVDIGLGVAASYKIFPRLAVRTSYDFAWLSGLALAPEQTATLGEINTNATLFYHGLTLGLDWSR